MQMLGRETVLTMTLYDFKTRELSQVSNSSLHHFVEGKGADDFHANAGL